MSETSETFKLHGDYVCQESGRKYKYYGKYMSHPNIGVEAYLYAHDKKFVHDSIFESPDLLAKIKLSSESLVNLPMSYDLLEQLAKCAVEQEIEKFDTQRGPARGGAL